MIFLHDSMFLERLFTQQELQPKIKFHWHFVEHRWDDDGLINSILSFLPDSKGLIDYNVNKKSLWHGCYGIANIIDLSVLEQLESKYHLTERLVHVINSRDHRMALERVFGILLFKEGFLTKENCSNFGCIHDYPKAFYSIDLKALKESYSGAILKTWHGR